MTDAQLLNAVIDARDKAHGCKVYLGSETYHATRSGRTSASAADEWMRLRDEAIKRGLMQ